MRLTRRVVTRVALSVATLFGITVVTFVGLNVVPGDPARGALGLYASPQALASFREREGLNRPILTRYAIWLKNMSSGNWGYSLVDGGKVSAKVWPRAVRSMIIAVAGFLLATVGAAGLGTFAAVRGGRAIDGTLSIGAVVLAAAPEFVVAIMLIYVFGVELQVLPVDSTAALVAGPLRATKAYVLPAVSLALLTLPYLFRLIRANVRDVMDAPYVRAAESRGIAGRHLIIGHVAPNALLPVISGITLSLAELLGGIIVIENVFAFPGLGQLLVDGIRSGDAPVVQAVAVIVGTGFIVLNGLADAVSYWLNPKERTAT